MATITKNGHSIEQLQEQIVESAASAKAVEERSRAVCYDAVWISFSESAH